MSALGLFLALLLLVSALHKYVARDQLAVATAKLVGVSAQFGPLFLLAAGLVEICAAFVLLLSAWPLVGALMAAALWGLYALALLARRGQSLDCGCDFTRRAKPVTWGAVLRPLVLMSLALLWATSPERALHWDTPFAALALLVLYFAATELAALPSRVRRHI